MYVTHFCAMGIFSWSRFYAKQKLASKYFLEENKRHVIPISNRCHTSITNVAIEKCNSSYGPYQMGTSHHMTQSYDVFGACNKIAQHLANVMCGLSVCFTSSFSLSKSQSFPIELAASFFSSYLLESSSPVTEPKWAKLESRQPLPANDTAGRKIYSLPYKSYRSDPSCTILAIEAQHHLSLLLQNDIACFARDVTRIFWW